MIQIILNGKSYNIKEKTNITSLLEILSLSKKKVAVEINEEVLPRDSYDKKILSSNDRVEIVNFIGGG